MLDLRRALHRRPALPLRHVHPDRDLRVDGARRALAHHRRAQWRERHGRPLARLAPAHVRHAPRREPPRAATGCGSPSGCFVASPVVALAVALTTQSVDFTFALVLTLYMWALVCVILALIALAGLVLRGDALGDACASQVRRSSSPAPAASSAATSSSGSSRDGAHVRAMLRYTSRGQRGCLDLLPDDVARQRRHHARRCARLRRRARGHARRRRHVPPGGADRHPVLVRAPARGDRHEHRRHVERADRGEGARHARAHRADVDQRGVRLGAARADGRRAPAAGAVAVLGDEDRRRCAGRSASIARSGCR